MRVIGIGETVLDIVFKDDQPQRAVPGGSTFNAIISLGRMGMPAMMLTEVGDDHVGNLTCSFLRENGVDDSHVVHNPGMRSHISLAFLNEHNDADYAFYKDPTDFGHTLLIDLQEDDIVLFGSYYAVGAPTRRKMKELLRRVKVSGAKAYYDINFRKPHVKDIPFILPAVRENMQHSSVVRGSMDDCQLLFGLTDVDAIYEQEIRPYCPCFICTNGSKTIAVRTPKYRLEQSVRQIETVSTIGAGDNFNAGFLYGLNKKGQPLEELSEQDWLELLRCGQDFAQEVCQRYENNISPEFASRYTAIKF